MTPFPLKNIRGAIPENERQSFDIQFSSKEKSEAMALVLSVFLGMLGIDRMYVGQPFIGILKFLTLSGFGLWAVIDWFVIKSVARTENINIATRVSYIVSGVGPVPVNLGTPSNTFFM